MMVRDTFKYVIPIVIVEFSISLAGFWMLGDYDVARFNVWPISEWLINYQAGFVRRGLFGEALYQLHMPNGSIPILYPLVFSFYCLYTGIFICNYVLSRIHSSIVLVLALLIPGGIFHMAMGAFFYARKEILFLIHFGLLCLIYVIIGRSSEKIKPILIVAFGSIAIIGGVLLTLIHEPYLFMAYPITLLLCVILAKENNKFSISRVFGIIYALVIPFIFLICSFNHGDQFASQKIWDSYQLSDRLVLAPVAPYTAALSTAGLGWGVMQHLSTIYGVFISGTAIYWAFFWLANGLVVLYIASRISIGHLASTNQGASNISIDRRGVSYVLTVAFGFLISSSMFFIASDYGRWIACATNLTILFCFAINRSTYVAEFFTRVNVGVFKACEYLIKLSRVTAVLVVIVFY